MQVRVRVELPDTPGALASLAVAFSESYVNILSVRVYHAAGTVIDDFVLEFPDYWAVGDVRDLILGAGGTNVSVLESARGDLEDEPTLWLHGALAVLAEPDRLDDIVASLMGPVSTPVHAEAQRAHLLTRFQLVATGDPVPTDGHFAVPDAPLTRSLVGRGAAVAGDATRATLRRFRG